MNDDRKAEFFSLWEKLTEREQACVLIDIAMSVSVDLKLSPEIQIELEQVALFLDKGGDDQNN